MKPLSKVWGVWLLVAQVLNGATAALGGLNALPDSFPSAATLKAHALMIHIGIGVLVGSVQAFAKALPDTDGDGVPDLFDDTPQG